MRLTVVLFRFRHWHEMKTKWGYKGVFRKNLPWSPPSALTDRGIEVIDPLQDIKGEEAPWKPPVPDPRFPEPVNIEEKENFNDNPAFIIQAQTHLLEGIDQACILTKSHAIQGMPKQVEKLIGAIDMPHRDLLLQRYIMLSQVWNTNQDKLSKRFDPRKPGWKFKREFGITPNDSAKILCRSLLRYCSSLGGRFPSMINDRRVIHQPYLHSYYHFKKDNLITFAQRNEWTIYGKEPLALFAENDDIDKTVHFKLPDLFPVSPTIDLKKDHCYTMRNCAGFKKPYSVSCPQTIVKLISQKKAEKFSQSSALLTTFGYALAAAHQLYGEDVTVLPKPLAFQCISLSENEFNFLFFQLNTMNYNNDDGVKNLVWFDSGHYLFDKVLGQPWMPKALRLTQLKDYNPETFEKFLAVYLNGVPEVQQLLSNNQEIIT